MSKTKFFASAIASVLFATLTLGQAAVGSADEANPIERVNPFIGTGGNAYVCAHNTPGATTPFGLIRLSPDTISAGGKTAINTSGYYYNDPRIVGFSHTRLCGTGAIDGGHFRVMPTGLETSLAELRRGVSAPLSHDRETATPGYYSIEMPEIKVRAELTATERVGLHRYHFAADATPRILIDIGSALGNGKSNECTVQVDQETNSLTGSVRTFGSFSGRFGGLKVYFAATFNRAWTQHTTWSGSETTANERQRHRR